MGAIVRIHTQAYRFLELIAISGEFPMDSIPLLFGDGRYQEKVITELKEKGYIKVYHKDKLWGYRLTTNAKQYLMEMNQDRFCFFLEGCSETNVLKSEWIRRNRLHSISQAYLLMQLAGVEIFRDKKWMLFSPALVSEKRMEIDIPMFFNSRELKEVTTETEKIKNSRSVGVLVTKTDGFVVYNTGSYVLKWQTKSELRMKAVISYYLSLHQILSNSASSMKAIMIGKDMETAFSLLTSTGGYKKGYFTLDETFEHLYFIPLDRYGIGMIKLLSDKMLYKKLCQFLFVDLQKSTSVNADYEAIDQWKHPVLFAFDFDMPRIARFCSFIHLRNIQGILICFDFQKEVLQRFCGTQIDIQTIDYQKFERRFFSG